MSYGGLGVIISKSGKLKQNAGSSTVAQLFGVNKYLPKVLLTKRFMEAQGYPTDATIYQDSQSCMGMTINGQKSCNQTTRHLDSRYFLIKGHIDHGDIDLEHIPTNKT